MTWNKAKAKSEIRKYFKKHGVSAKSTTTSATDGKIYELYCLVEVLRWLKSRYRAHIGFQGATVDFKASPGFDDRNRSYFVVSANGNSLELHTDIEVNTLGSKRPGTIIDNSSHHEIDLVLIPPTVLDGTSPAHDELVLGVECKAHANLGKGVVRQVLGIRRELSYLTDDQDALIDLVFGCNPCQQLPAHPASHYWLAFIDHSALKYAGSPGAFGIEFKNWMP